MTIRYKCAAIVNMSLCVVNSQVTAIGAKHAAHAQKKTIIGNGMVHIQRATHVKIIVDGKGKQYNE